MYLHSVSIQHIRIAYGIFFRRFLCYRCIVTFVVVVDLVVSDLLSPDDAPPASLGSAFTVIFSPSQVIIISPCRSVRYTFTPAPFSLSSVSVCGCPYELPVPQDMTAYSGLAAVRKALLVEVLLQWWPTFSTSQSISAVIVFSSPFSASPVNKNFLLP